MESVPTISMNPADRYVTQSSVYGNAYTGPLTNARIRHYQKMGHYREPWTLHQQVDTSLPLTPAEQAAKQRQKQQTLLAKAVRAQRKALAKALAKARKDAINILFE